MSTAKGSPKSAKNRKAQRAASYSPYIYKVLKQVHPDTGLSSKATAIMNGIAHSVVGQVAHAINGFKSKRTVTSREVQTGVRLVLPGELAKHAISEGTKAVTYYNATISQEEPSRSPAGSKKGRHGTTFRAHLQFSVSRVKRDLVAHLEGPHTRKGSGAPVYLAGVVEYIVAEIIELAGNAARDDKRTRIVPRHIYLAITNDDELLKLFFGGVTGGLKTRLAVVPFGGEELNIHSALLPKKRSKEEGRYVGEEKARRADAEAQASKSHVHRRTHH